MSLILAIEADRRQATLLASIGRRLGAELVIAPTAEGGLEAIDGRVPDLILASALLSPRDDAAIAARLRDLDTAASHVQMLTIPVLEKASRRHAAPAGLLGKLRGGAAQADPPAGCDPSLFAEQVSEYLRRAAAEREARQPAIEPEEPPVVAVTADGTTLDEQAIAAADPVTAFQEPDAEDRGEATASEPLVVSDVVAVEVAISEAVAVEVEPAIAAEPAVALDATAAPEAIAAEEVPVASETIPEEVAEPVLPPAESFVEPIAPVYASDPVVIPLAADPVVIPLTLVAAEPEPEPGPAEHEPSSDDEGIKLAHELDPEPDAISLTVSALTSDVEAALREFQAALADIETAESADAPATGGSEEWTSPSKSSRSWPSMEGFTDEPPAAGAVSEAATIAPDPRADERDLNAAPQTVQTVEPKSRPHDIKPAQDEWGLFDPNQCGFAALLEKLERIASANDAA